MTGEFAWIVTPTSDWLKRATSAHVTPLRTDGYDRTHRVSEHPHLVDIDQPPAPVSERQRLAQRRRGLP